MNKHFIIIYAILLYIIYKLNSNKNIEHMSATSGNISAAALNKLDTFLSDINGTLTVKNLKVLGNTDITGKTTIGGDTNITGKTTIGGDTTINGNTTIESNASIGSKLTVNTKKNVSNNALEIYLNKSGDPEYYFFNKNECGHFKNNTGHQPMKIAKLNVTDHAYIKKLDIPSHRGTTHFNYSGNGQNYIRGDTTIDGNIHGQNNIILSGSGFKFRARYKNNNYIGGTNLSANNGNGWGQNHFTIEKH